MEFSIKLSVYFEVKDSPVFGGHGTVGYACMSINVKRISYEKDNLFNNAELMNEYIEGQAKDMAEFCEVPRENVRIISEEEYEENTEEGEEE